MSFQAIVKPYPAATIAAGAAKGIGKSLAKLGASAAFLVTDQGVTGAGITAQLEGYITEAGIECVVFDQVEANPTMSIVSAWQQKALAAPSPLTSPRSIRIGAVFGSRLSPMPMEPPPSAS